MNSFLAFLIYSLDLEERPSVVPSDALELVDGASG